MTEIVQGLFRIRCGSGGLVIASDVVLPPQKGIA
jgi:hypothetical protein